jgi:hypothetical protein
MPSWTDLRKINLMSGGDDSASGNQRKATRPTNVWLPVFQILRAVLVGIGGFVVAAIAWFLLALPLSAAITLLPAPLDRFSLESVWSIPIFGLVILATAYLAARSVWAFLVICAAGIGLVWVSMFYGKYVVDTRWRGTDVYQVSASGDAATMRQMYYDILVRQTWPPPDVSHRWSDFIYEALKDRLRQQIEAKRRNLEVCPASEPSVIACHRAVFDRGDKKKISCKAAKAQR